MKIQEKQVAIKILRPDIEKLFNEELDTECCLVYMLKIQSQKPKD